MAVIAATLALGLGACSPGGEDPAPAPGSPSGGAEGAGSSTTPATTTAARATPEEPLAQREASIDGKPVRLEIVRLQRDGAVTNLTVRLVAEGDDGSGIGAQVSSDLSDGVTQRLRDGEDEDPSVFDGPQLIDAKNRKLYLVARDSTGRCVCDADLGSTFVEADAPVVLSATLGAPPADVTRVDVRIPSFGTFDDVPLS